MLLIKLDHIGDLALALPACRALAAASQSGKVDLVVSPVNEGWREVLPWVENFYTIQFPGYQSGRGKKYSRLKTLVKLLALVFQLRVRQNSVAIDLRTLPGDWRGKLIAFLSGARVRIGETGAGDCFITQPLSHRAVHQSDILLECVESYFGELEASSLPITSIRRNRPHSDKLRIVFHPGAGFSSKMWPETHWIELRRIMTQELPDVEVQWLGGEKERELLENLSMSSGRQDVFTVSHSIKETLQILADADLLLGLDSAAPHMAALVNTPTVTIFSGANEVERWKALGDNTVLTSKVICSPCHLHACNQSAHFCMQNISPEEVAQTIQKKLKSLSLPQGKQQ